MLSSKLLSRNNPWVDKHLQIAYHSISIPRKIRVQQPTTINAPHSTTMTQHINTSSKFWTSQGVSSRCFSDRLLGHSPMAPPVSNTIGMGSNISHIPTEQEVTTAGGVWAPTSAKREKLRELKVELVEESTTHGISSTSNTVITTLDDFASRGQLSDLYLVDGMAVIAHLADETRIRIEANASHANGSLFKVLGNWNARLEELPTEVTQEMFEAFFAAIKKDINDLLTEFPAERSLQDIRDFYLPEMSFTSSPLPPSLSSPSLTPASPAYDPESAPVSEPVSRGKLSAADEAHNKSIQSLVEQAVLRFRLILALGVAEHLLNNWKILTMVTDQDVDRAAVSSSTSTMTTITTTTILPTTTSRGVRVRNAHAVLVAYLIGNCYDRVEAFWNLIDHDGDGIIDKEEMVHVCDLSIEPYRKALRRLFKEALETSTARTLSDASTSLSAASTTAPGWRKRRSEAKIRKRLTSMFERTLKVHFVDEVEYAHRLRCCYAWANKAHQENMIKSVMVDENGGWSGRKRYVELQPKISLSEFRVVQQVHFRHLNRVSGEFLKSFREELWIDHGKYRNRRKLLQKSSLFLTVVCTIDYLIGTL